MGDDVGWFNIGAYHRGIMSGKTPNLDKLAAQGMMFTDYYAEASCTAGRANFITGEIPLRTGLTTVGQAGADVGMPAQACTIATALKAQGYATGQFGKNHLGDLNKFLPTLHGFDEFFGYLYHLDAMSDPYWYSFPHGPGLLQQVRAAQPRAFLGDRRDDADRHAALGQGRQAEDRGRRPAAAVHEHDQRPNMAGRPPEGQVRHGDLRRSAGRAAQGFMDKAKKDGKPFFVWHNTTRMHVFTFLSQKYQAMMNCKTNYGLEEAGMAQMDDSVGALLKHLDDIGEADNTIVVFTTDNGAEVFTWPDGGMTPFKGTKGTVMEGGFRAPASPAGRARSSRARSRTASSPASTGSRRLLAAAGNPNITDQLLKGVKLGDRTYKNHLDGYNQLDLLRATGRPSARSSSTSAARTSAPSGIDDFKYQFYQQPHGWPGAEGHDRHARPS